MRHLLPDDIAFEARRLGALGLAAVEALGEGPPAERLWVLRIGRGERHIAVKANAHADEPAGTVTCFRLVAQLADSEVLERFTFHLLPSANPLGLERNRGWLGSTEPDLLTWFRAVRRDPPAEDREFGYGERPELAAHRECAWWHGYLDRLPRLDGYVSLHSMAFAGGAWFLVMLDDLARWTPLLDALAAGARTAGLPLHDEDRGGRKGFCRLRPGFCTAPTREAMAAFFGSAGRPARLGLNSMQVVRLRHGTPVALVSELPQWWDPRLADMTPTQERRADLDRRLAERLAETVAELTALDASEAGATAEHRSAAAAALGATAEQWGERPALRRDQTFADLQVLCARAQNAAIALRAADAAGDVSSTWVAALTERVAAITERFTLRALPLSEQVALQVAMVLTLADHLTAETG